MNDVRSRSSRTVAPLIVTAAALFAMVLVVAGETPAKQDPPPPPPGKESDAPPAPAPSPVPEAPAPPAPGATPAPGASPAPPAPEASPAPPPRIIRVVCTDKICGNCDGKCHKNSGHVAVDKKGHCACTPTEGSPLDRATRDAYEKRPPQ